MKLSRTVLVALLCLYAAKQMLFVIWFPPFTGHDEVAHFAYLRIVATEHRVPVLMQDTMPEDLGGFRRFALDWAEGEPGPMYAANHPPLYYAVMTPLYWLSDHMPPTTQQYLLRMAAIPFGILVVVLAYKLAMAVFPGDRFLAVTVPAAVALQPQISYEAAMINNDIVAIAIYSALLLLLVLALRSGFKTRQCVGIGSLIGLGLLTKGTTLTILPLVAAALVLAHGWRPGAWIRATLPIAVPAAVISGPWYLFLYRTYGNLSGFPQIQQMQQSWNFPDGTFLELLYSLDFVTMRFRETWGEFGWRRLPLGETLLMTIGAIVLCAVVGLIVYAAVPVGSTAAGKDPVLRPDRTQVAALWLLALSCAVSYLAVVQFGTSFQLTQARYFFPTVNAAAVLLMLGVRTLFPMRWHAYGAVTSVVGLLGLHGILFTRYIIPFYPQW